MLAKSLTLALLLLVSAQALAQTESKDLEAFAKTVVLPPSHRLELFAREPLVQNPVAFEIDRFGRVWIAETDRQEHYGVPDNRSHPYWVDDDLSAQTVHDRRAMYLKHLPKTTTEWTEREDRVVQLFDDDRDGRADRRTLFAGGFNDLLDGTGAGVLAVDGSVWFTCIPHVWRLSDKDGDGVAEERESLHFGYGVRVALRGHDLHGLIRGPDDRIYFSIGDRGYNIELKDGRTLKDPDSGAVFRCEPDGTGLEVFHTGLRNPQELAFDDFGELWTVDNNSDAGDRARVIHLLPGGDCGWRMTYQTRPDRGPWMPEGWWKPRHKGQPAFLNAPLANLGAGPSGFFCDPGLALEERHRGRFFFCDFTGSVLHSGIRSFRARPDGAGFRITEDDHWLKGILATDAAPGPDGAIWVLDWVEGWVGVQKGRIWRAVAATEEGQAIGREVSKWLATDFDLVPLDQLGLFFNHRDRRVRDEAHRAMARRGESGRRTALAFALDKKRPALARRHALFALGILARREGVAAAEMLPLLSDAEALIREGALRVLGETTDERATGALIAALADPEPRAVAAAAHALGKIGGTNAFAPLVAVAEANRDQDAVLRHAVVQGLSGIIARGGGLNALLSAAESGPPAVRRVVVLTLRQLNHPRIARFLTDPDPAIATEAALAAHDRPIPAAWPELAALVGKEDLPDPLLRRAISALDLLSEPGHARVLADFAADAKAPAWARAEALDILRTWEKPRPFDRVLNTFRPRPPRLSQDAEAATLTRLPEILRGAPPEVLSAAAATAAALGHKDCIAPLDAIARDEAQNPDARLAALKALRKLFKPGLHDLVQVLLTSSVPALRAAAVDALVDVSPDAALSVIGRALEDGGTVHERQLGLLGLKRLPPERASALLLKTLERAAGGQFPADAWLELAETARDHLKRVQKAEGTACASQLAAFEARMAATFAEAAAYAVALEGGHPEAGRKIFQEHPGATCTRCHAIDDKATVKDAALAGPRLDGVGSRLSRKQLLESIVRPDNAIAVGYENLMIETKDGLIIRGRLTRETAEALELQVLEAGEWEAQTVAKDAILTRVREPSSMPADLVTKLKAREIRDLVAWLATLQDAPAGPEKAAGEGAGGR